MLTLQQFAAHPPGEDLPMKEIRLYTTPTCPFCHAAKRLLQQKGLPFEEIDVSSPGKRAEIREQSGWRTVPVVYIGSMLVGGYSELANLEAEGRLTELVAS